MLRSAVSRGASTVHSRRTPRLGSRHHPLGWRISAKKSSEEERDGGDANANAPSGVLPGRSVLLRAGAVIFALGFVDAGYVSSHQYATHP
jgi:hypothetical protein